MQVLFNTVHTAKDVMTVNEVGEYNLSGHKNTTGHWPMSYVYDTCSGWILPGGQFVIFMINEMVVVVNSSKRGIIRSVIKLLIFCSNRNDCYYHV